MGWQLFLFNFLLNRWLRFIFLWVNDCTVLMKEYPKITCKGYRHCSGYLLLSNFSIFIFWSCFIVMSKHVAGGRLSMMFGFWKGKDAIPTKRTTRSLVIQANWSFGCRHAMHQASILGWNQCYKLVMLQTGLLDTWLSQLQKVIYSALPRTKTVDTIPTPAGRCNFSCSVSFQSGNMMQYHHALNLSNQWRFGVQKIAGDDAFPIICRCGSPKIRCFSLWFHWLSWAKDENSQPSWCKVIFDGLFTYMKWDPPTLCISNGVLRCDHFLSQLSVPVQLWALKTTGARATGLMSCWWNFIRWVFRDPSYIHTKTFRPWRCCATDLVCVFVGAQFLLWVFFLAGFGSGAWNCWCWPSYLCCSLAPALDQQSKTWNGITFTFWKQSSNVIMAPKEGIMATGYKKKIMETG